MEKNIDVEIQILKYKYVNLLNTETDWSRIKIKQWKERLKSADTIAKQVECLEEIDVFAKQLVESVEMIINMRFQPDSMNLSFAQRKEIDKLKQSIEKNNQ